MEMKAPSLVALAKKRLSISELWLRRGWPGKPGKSCKFPDGSDTRASASIFAEGRLLKCFRSGRVFDAPALLAEVEGMTIDAACREFIALARLCVNHANPLNSLAPRTYSLGAFEREHHNFRGVGLRNNLTSLVPLVPKARTNRSITPSNQEVKKPLAPAKSPSEFSKSKTGFLTFSFFLHFSRPEKML